MGFEVKPSTEELQTATAILEKTVRRAAEELPKEEGVTVAVGWTEEEYVKEKMGGVNGFTISSTRIKIGFNTATDRWKDFLKAVGAHEYAHTFFLEAVEGEEGSDSIWQDLLFDAQSQIFAEAMYPEITTPWREKFGQEELEQWWPQVRDEELNKHYSAEENPVFYGTGEFPDWIGYSLSYRIGKELLEQYDISDFPTLEKEDVVKAGDALFD